MSFGAIPPTLPLALLCLGLTWLMARLYDQRQNNPSARPSQHLGDVALASLLGARAIYVCTHFSEYLQTPISIVAIGDGGFSWIGALLGAATGIIWKTRKSPEWRNSLCIFSMIGLSLYWGGLKLLHQPNGQLLAEYALTTLDGDEVSLGAKGLNLNPIAPTSSGSSNTIRQPMIINLWATWCGPCRREMPAFARAEQAFDDIDFVMLNQGESSDVARSYLVEKSLNFNYPLLDPNSAMLRSLNAQALPTTLFVSSRGEVLHTHMGELTYARLQDLANQLFGETQTRIPTK